MKLLYEDINFRHIFYAQILDQLHDYQIWLNLMTPPTVQTVEWQFRQSLVANNLAKHAKCFCFHVGITCQAQSQLNSLHLIHCTVALLC